MDDDKLNTLVDLLGLIAFIVIVFIVCVWAFS